MQNPLIHVFHVSPLCKEILKVSGKKICSLFVLIHLYKNLSENDLIRLLPLYDVITIFFSQSPTCLCDVKCEMFSV